MKLHALEYALSAAGSLSYVTPLLDQLLLPQRIASRGLDDLHRIAEAVAEVGGLARRSGRELGGVRGWMDDMLATAQSVRDEISAARQAIDPLHEDMHALRAEFGGANRELEAMRKEFGPELESIRTATEGLLAEADRLRTLLDSLNTSVREVGSVMATEVRGLQRTMDRLERDAEEMSEVIEPLQSATERVGRVADRLPGGPKRSAGR